MIAFLLFIAVWSLFGTTFIHNRWGMAAWGVVGGLAWFFMVGSPFNG